MSAKIESIRNIGLLGHTASGKTSLLNALMKTMGCQVSSPNGNGRRTEGPETMDTMAWHADWKKLQINLLDSPGIPELSGRSMEVLTAADSAMVVINASRGIEFVTQRMMDAARRRNVCRMIVISHIDQPGLDLPGLLSEIQQQFGDACLPLNLPTADGQVVDAYFDPQSQETLLGDVDEAHDALVDQVVEVDEELMARYLEQGEQLSPEQLHGPFEQALREGHLLPVCFVSTESGAGVELLLNVIEQLCPNPLESTPPAFIKGEGEQASPVEISQSADGHAIAHVFKVMVDPFIGKMGLLRVYQGELTSGMSLFIGAERKPVRVAQLYRLQGEQTEQVGRCGAGEICAISKVDELHYDAVLHDSHDEDHYHLRPLRFPDPMFGLALRPAKRGQEQKLSDVMHLMVDSDPSLRIEHRPHLNETVLWGLGERHVQSVLDQMQTQYQLDVATEQPSIDFRETISRPAQGHHRHKKQTGGAGQFGEVFLRIEPLERGSGFQFASEVVGGAIPGPFIPAVEKGVRQAMEEGALAGYPIQDIRVVVYDGKHHNVDSKEIAFVTAGKKAFLDAFFQAKPLLLEPVANLDIVAPETTMGDISGELSTLQGVICGTESLPAQQIEIHSQVPLRTLSGFHSRLKSLTAGEGIFTMAFSHFAPVSSQVQQDLVKQAH